MPKKLSEKDVYKGRLFTMKEFDVEVNGKKFTYEVVRKHTNSVLVVPVTPEGNVVFVREYFAAIDEYQLGLPKGKMDKGEKPLDGANRELQEEIGFKAGKLDLLAEMTIAPGYLTQKTHVYLATELKESKLAHDEDEEFEIIEHPLSTFEKLIESKQLTEARMIAALFLARRRLEKKK